MSGTTLKEKVKLYWRSIALGIFVIVAVWGCVSVYQEARAKWLAEAKLEELEAEWRRNPKDNEITFYYCYRLRQAEQATKAQGLMETLVKRAPGEWRYWDGLARCAGLNLDGVRAVEACQRALALNPNHAPLHAELAQFYSEANLLTDALSEFDKALQLNKKAPISREHYAKCLINTDRYQEAWDALNYSLEKIPYQNSAYSLFTTVAVHLKEFDITKTKLMRRIKMVPMYPTGIFYNGLALLELHNYQNKDRLKDAELFAQRAIADKEQHPEFYATYGRILKEMGQLDSARNYVEKGLDLGAENVECLETMILLAEAKGNTQDIAKWKEKLAVAKEKDPEIRQLRQETETNQKTFATLTTKLEEKKRYSDAVEAGYLALKAGANPKEINDLMARCRAQAIKKLTLQVAKEEKEIQKAQGIPTD